MQRLQVRDAASVTAFHKTVSQKIYGRKGVSSLQKIGGQVVLLLSGENTLREVESEAQLTEILEQLPHTSKHTEPSNTWDLDSENKTC